MAINSSNPKYVNPYENEIISTRESVLDRQVITAYGPKIRQQLKFIGDGATKQSFKDECDINRIMARYQVTGVLPENITPGTPQYVDVTGIDYQTGMQKIAAAQSLFAGLPAAVRYRFKNDPGEFLAFTENPDEAAQAELIELGLAKRPAHEPLAAEAPPAPQASTARASTARSSSAKGSGEVQSQTLPGVPDGEK